MLTYQKLCSEDASSLTVRDLARENGCSPAALYKHFDSLEYLITVASVRFLDGYMREYANLLDSDKDFLEIYIQGWELFDKHAFHRPDIYYRLFWGEDNSIFGNAFQDYFELFPFKGSEKYTAHYYTLLFNENLQERFYDAAKAGKHGADYRGRRLVFQPYQSIDCQRPDSKCHVHGGKERTEQELLCNRLIRKNMEKVAK